MKTSQFPAPGNAAGRVCAALLAVILLGFPGCAPRGTGDATDPTGAELSYSCAPTEASQTEAPTAAPTQSPTVPVETAAPGPVGFGAQTVTRISGLPTAKAMQQFVLVRGSGSVPELYATQRSGTVTILSRAEFEDDSLKKAKVVSTLELKGYGHGESLDAAVVGDKTYLYLGSDANDLVDYAWATTVTRAEYTDAGLTNCRKITDVQYATPDGSLLFSGATPYRINFAVDTEADLLVLYIRADKNHTGSGVTNYLAAYRLSAINRRLDETETVSLRACGADYVVGSTAMTTDASAPGGSFQGVEVSPDGYVYITGGTTSIIPAMRVYKIDRTDIRLIRTRTIYWMKSAVLGTRDWTKTKNYVEIESIKYFEGKLYCSFNPTGGSITDGTELYELMG